MPDRFPPDVLAKLETGKYLRIRAGEQHRFIGIWVVVVEKRAFVRSWTQKPRSWWRTFLEEPRGELQVPGYAKAFRVRAVQTKSERLRDAVDAAYLEKYNTKGSLHYSRGFRTKRRRDTTTELLPLGSGA